LQYDRVVFAAALKKDDGTASSHAADTAHAQRGIDDAKAFEEAPSLDIETGKVLSPDLLNSGLRVL
jgi:hypothetical protein